MLERIGDYDRDLLVFLNNLGIERYDAFWSTITRIEVWIPLYLFFIFLIYKAWQSNKPGVSLLFGAFLVISVSLFTFLVKSAVRRLRPSNVEEFSKLLRVLLETDSYSFFSGHAANSFSITTFVVLMIREKFKWAPVLFIWPALFSFSRIYVGVHYPSDILTGMLIGISFGLIFFNFHKRYRQKHAI